MVTLLDKAIERYVDGLPDPVQDIVTGSNPTTVRQAIELVATLTESQIRKGKLHRKGDKKQSSDKSENKKGKKVGSSKRSRKSKASQNFAVTAQVNQAAPNQPAQPPVKKQYFGNAPLCNRCNSHHQPHIQCRYYTNCRRSGHLAAIFHLPANQNQAAQNPAQQATQLPAQQHAQAARPHYPHGSCYNCGDLTNYRNQFSRLINANQAQARGRIFNMNANEARTNNEVVNGAAM
ncbi:hypothetical protein HanRHA438_Chr10g0446101 [Helianthus annuus]|nr:hypothetical protein HanIR_Chr10g0467821 [Helianthus annuus]KAJ0878976.1 hypothetical protein HanRHA438_Chr10g0446101 [Helianthus annuus]